MIDQDKTCVVEAIMRDQERRFVMNNIAKPATGETPDGRPSICEVLGVEVGERFRVESDDCCLYPEAFVDDDEIVRASVGYAMDGMRLCQIIKGELRIIRKPRFTEEEVAFMRTIYAVAPSACFIRDNECRLYLTDVEEFEINSLMPIRLLPSLHPGQSVALADIVGA